MARSHARWLLGMGNASSQNGPCGGSAEGSDRSGVHLPRLLRPTAAGHGGWQPGTGFHWTRHSPLKVTSVLRVRHPSRRPVRDSPRPQPTRAKLRRKSQWRSDCYCFFQPLYREGSGRMRVKPGAELTLPALPDDSGGSETAAATGGSRLARCVPAWPATLLQDGQRSGLGGAEHKSRDSVFESHPGRALLRLELHLG